MASVGIPYSPTAFPTSVVNPVAAGVGIAATDIPYISPSEYLNYPTAMSPSDLIPGGDETAQQGAFYELLVQAADWADRYTMGSDLASKGASLRATLNVEVDSVPLINGQLKLICDFKPLLEVRGIDVGVQPGSLSSIGQTLASGVRLGRRTIYVPYAVPVYPSGARFFGNVMPPQELVAAWSYVNGYPHSKLTADIAGGDNTCTLQATDGDGGLLGVYPGTVLRIVDGSSSEVFTVLSVAANVVTASANFRFDHTLPPAPDFLPVTAVPPGARLASAYVVTGLLKTRGDGAVYLDEVSEPRSKQSTVGELGKDFTLARRLLDRYVVRLKSPR